MTELELKSKIKTEAGTKTTNGLYAAVITPDKDYSDPSASFDPRSIHFYLSPSPLVLDVTTTQAAKTRQGIILLLRYLTHPPLTLLDLIMRSRRANIQSPVNSSYRLNQKIT